MLNAFEQNQKDLTLDNILVLWQAHTVTLHKVEADGLLGDPLTFFTCGPNLIDKIERWCVKNNYRCAQIQNGRIML